MAKRFYTHVSVKRRGAHFIIMLDGRVLKTQGKHDLVFACKSHAQLVAAEWQGQKDDILPATMPCTRLMNVACEQTPSRRAELVQEFCAYAQTDLLCYRVASPADLAQRQHEAWQSVLDWAHKTHAIALATTTGISALKQPQSSLKNARHYAEKQDDIALTLLVHFTASFGSAILAMAVLQSHLSARQAFALSKLDECYQNERWGADEQAVHNSNNVLAELEALSHLIGRG